MAVLVIDDQDPALVYGSGWTHYQYPSAHYNDTSSLSRGQGSRVTLQFNGISIAVYGSPGPNTTVAFTTVVDSGSSALTNVPTPTAQQYRQLFFQSPHLSAGNHSFVLTNVDDDDWLWLDYFAITTDLPGSTSSTVSAQVMITTSPQSTNPPQNNTQSSSNHPPIAAIVGEALGGIAVICVLVFCFLYLRRRRPSIIIDGDNPSTLAQPFILNPITLTPPIPSSSNKNVRTHSRPVLVGPPPIYEERAQIHLP
ncbi:hypothetical protein BYT27DRAFT_7202077 [Phlegmacium glaucopus]|nr:hypothetical protein BYT27DRAFT_7202077 [Phlegmacium glaucopus]